MTERTSTGTVSDDFGTPIASIRILAPGSEIGSRFEVQGVLGTGGSAVVYLAYDRELNRQVALKVLRADRMTEATLKRFRREVAVARDASSPYLVKTFDIGQAGEAVFLTMEAVDGESLRALLERERPPLEEVLRIAIDALKGLRDLHALGIIHRDIKPGNILISKDGVVKLGDFGLARRAEGEASRVTETLAMMVGTAEYLSPEQALGNELDARSDLYSFGVLLYEMVAGKVPFERTSSIGVAMAHVKERPKPLVVAAKHCPRWLSELVGRLLEKDAAHRYQDAGTLLLDLEKRRSSGSTARLGRKAKRVALTVAVVAAVVAAAWGIALWNRPRFARLVADGDYSVRGVDLAGKTLWHRNDVSESMASAVAKASDGKSVIAAVLGGKLEMDPARNHTLSLLDPETGRVTREFPLAKDGGTRFHGFSDSFVPAKVFAADLDGDAIDEIFVAYAHNPYWPSYTVVVDQRTGLSRVVFLATGHHNPVGVADVDGDGRKELILAGPNNRLGYQFGVAAVRVPFESPDPSRVLPVACTPDGLHGNPESDDLVWYALGPVFHSGSLPPSLQPGESYLQVTSGDRKKFRMGLNGFAEEVVPVRVKERQAARHEAYVSVRESFRRTSIGNISAAIAAADRAVESATAAADAPLAAWAKRHRAGLLIRDGRPADAEREFEPLLADEGYATEVAFDAARGFHLAGYLDLASRWYERALGFGTDFAVGRPKWECVEGRLLALLETRSFEEAVRWVDWVAEIYPWEIRLYIAVYRQLISWRRGDRVGVVVELGKATPDLHRYWVLEWRLAAGEPVASVAARLDEEEPRASDTKALLKSLRGELLFRGGKLAEAFETEKSAFEEVLRLRPNDLNARFHFDAVADRYARIAEKAGHAEEGKRARLETARTRRRRSVH